MLNELLLRSLTDKIGEKHNRQNSCGIDKKIHDKPKNSDDESLNNSQSSYCKSTNSFDSGEPIKNLVCITTSTY